MNPTDLIDRDSLRDDIPRSAPVTRKGPRRVVEGVRERVQIFQGVVIRRQGSGVHETFTVRKIASASASSARSRSTRRPSPRLKSNPTVTCVAPSSTTSVICVEKPPRSRSFASPSARSSVGEEELDDYESTLELALVQEYKAVVGTFNYAVETDRVSTSPTTSRSKSVPRNADPTGSDAERRVGVDMYRTARFVPSVRVLTFRDVNIEKLPKRTCSLGHGARSTRRSLRGPRCTRGIGQDQHVVVSVLDADTIITLGSLHDRLTSPIGVWLELSRLFGADAARDVATLSWLCRWTPCREFRERRIECPGTRGAAHER